MDARCLNFRKGGCSIRATEKFFAHEKANMYVPALTDVGKFDVAKASEFVEFWSRFYAYEATVFGTKQKVDYFSELNVGNDLTAENVRRLLRWKDERMLSERTLSGPNKGKENPRVVKVVASLGAINEFRKDASSNSELLQTLVGIFPNGVVWGAFLLHIAKPDVYPIADQNVFRTCSLHTGLEDKQTWETYAAYCEYFTGIAKAVGVAQTVENLRQLKRIDDALFVFGQFLKDYHPRFAAKPETNKKVWQAGRANGEGWP
jgi:hypothetical protein